MEWVLLIMKFKQIMSIFIIVLSFVSLTVTASADTNGTVNSTSYAGARPVDFPVFNLQVFDQLEEQDDNYILGKGQIPLITSDSAKRNWLNDLNNVNVGVRTEIMAEYMRPNGSVMSYGYNYQGYLSVQFPEGTEVNESLINEIYSIFDQEAMKNNISGVPVLFEYSPEITVGESFSTVDYEIDDEPEIINESVNNTEPSHDIPGFTFFISVLAFLIASGKR